MYSSLMLLFSLPTLLVAVAATVGAAEVAEVKAAVATTAVGTRHTTQ
jgi:hypothetical protein